MELNGVRPDGSGLEYAGWRVLPHFYIPKSWDLPVGIGLVTEFSFVRPIYAVDLDTWRSVLFLSAGWANFRWISIPSLPGRFTDQVYAMAGISSRLRAWPAEIAMSNGWCRTWSGTANSARHPGQSKSTNSSRA
jgi:hypothetical protein